MSKPRLGPRPKGNLSKRRGPSEPDVSERSFHSPPKPGFHFTEAVGKTVARISYIDDAPDWQSLQVRFTDGTLFSFDLSPQVSVRAEYLESRRGDLEVIREYGIVESKDGEDVEDAE
jgi:hypothetical protein